VQAAIDNLYQDINESISAIKITWNNTLAQAGLLAHVEFQSGNDASHSEHAYLEVGLDDTTVFLKRITYIDQSGSYINLRLDKTGHPELASNNGSTYGYMNYIDTKIVDWINTSTYNPKRSGYLVGNGGFSDREETVYVSDQFAHDLVAIFNNFAADAVDQGQILQLVRQAMTLVQNVQCAGKTGASCSNKGLDAIVLAQSDTAYVAQTVSVTNDALSPDICLIDVNIPGGQSCSPMPSLAEFNVVIQQGYDAYRGMVVPDWFAATYDPEYRWDKDITLNLNMFKAIDAIEFRKVTFVCYFEVSIIRFVDGTYYMTGPTGIDSVSCGAPLVYYCSNIEGENTPACGEKDEPPWVGWPGVYDSDYDLTMDVLGRLYKKGFGFVFDLGPASLQEPRRTTLWDTERLKYYRDPDLKISKELDRDISNENFYYVATAQNITRSIWGNPIQATLHDSTAQSSTQGADWEFTANGIYRNRSGDEVGLHMFFQSGACVGPELGCYNP